jgi:hypothetical protein
MKPQAVVVFRRGHQGPWKSRPRAPGSIKVDDHRAAGIALALGFVLGAAVVALKDGRRAEVVPQPE